MKEQIVARLNAIAVNAYKLFGFAALALILAGLLSYLGLQAFFLVNRSWLAPTIVSSTDRQILELNAQIALQTAHRERLLAERRDIEVQLANAERVIEAHRQFDSRFAEAVAYERDAAKTQLEALGGLTKALEREADEIRESRGAFASLARVRASKLKEARLVDRETWLTTNHQLAQMADATFSFDQRTVTLNDQLAQTRRRVGGLNDLLHRLQRPDESSGAPTTEALLLEKELVRSSLEAARAAHTRDTLRLTLSSLDESIRRHAELLEAIRRSPWIRATERNVTVAFVPYENVDVLKEGEALHGCAVQLVWCRRIGTVKEIYEGEVTAKHPVRNIELRGVMVEIELEDARWAREPVLHAGGAPFLL